MSDSQDGTGPRVARPVLAPFRGPVPGAAPVGLRPPPTPGGRLTLPPFGAIRSAEPAPRPDIAERPWAKTPSAVLTLAEHHRAAEARETTADEWYDSAEVSEAASEPTPGEITEPAVEAFEAAVRDLPVYVPENVDVARFTPRVNMAIRPEPRHEPEHEPEPAMIPESTLEPTPEQVAAEWKALVGQTPMRSRTPVRQQTPVLAMEAVLASDAAEEAEDEELEEELEEALDAPAPHKMTPMRVTPMMDTRTPIHALTPVDGSPIVGMIPMAGNRGVAAALEAVAARVRRGELVVHGTVPETDDTHSLAAALAAVLGALLGVGR
jgi:hypothetical protein